MNEYFSKICPYCQTAFKEGDDIVVCSNCEMPHHKDCWIENKACTTFGCTGTISNADAQTQEAIDGVVFCTNCGAKMNGAQKFCTACGMPLQQKSEASHYTVAPELAAQQQLGYTPPHTQNAYTAQQGFDAQGNNQEMVTFVQKNPAYYVGEFAKLRTSENKISWNWCAFLFGAAWMGYRKMLLPALGWVVVSAIFGEIHALMSIILWAAPGLFGNYLYMLHADNEIAKTAGMEPIMRNATLASKGGTSVGMAIGTCVLGGILAGLFV